MANLRSKISLVILVLFLFTLTFNTFAKDNAGFKCILALEPIGECKPFFLGDPPIPLGWYCDVYEYSEEDCDGLLVPTVSISWFANGDKSRRAVASVFIWPGDLPRLPIL